MELAIQRGRDANRKRARGGSGDTEEDPLDGLELTLKTVARDVSCKAADGGGGLLAKIKAFNGFLERTAGVLEGRA